MSLKQITFDVKPNGLLDVIKNRLHVLEKEFNQLFPDAIFLEIDEPWGWRHQEYHTLESCLSNQYFVFQDYLYVLRQLREERITCTTAGFSNLLAHNKIVKDQNGLEYQLILEQPQPMRNLRNYQGDSNKHFIKVELL